LNILITLYESITKTKYDPNPKPAPVQHPVKEKDAAPQPVKESE